MFYTNYKEATLNKTKLNDVIEHYESKGYKCNLIEKE